MPSSLYPMEFLFAWGSTQVVHILNMIDKINNIDNDIDES